MTVHELGEVLYPETPVEICVDFDPVYIGTAEDAMTSKFFNRTVEEVYIGIDGTKLVVSVAAQRNIKKK